MSGLRRTEMTVRRLLALGIGALTVIGCSAMGPVGDGAQAPAADRETSNAGVVAPGCGAITDEAIAALGIDDRPLIAGDDRDWDDTPIEDTQDQEQINQDKAASAGLGIDPAALPGGLAVAYRDTHPPIHSVRYFMTSEEWTGRETYHDVLTGGGAVLVVSYQGEGYDVVANELAFARKVGNDSRLGVVKVGEEDAIVAHGDPIGDIRSWNVIWSDRGRSMNLDTGFHSGAEAVNLARAISCD
jgi:hypothetical protein